MTTYKFLRYLNGTEPYENGCIFLRYLKLKTTRIEWNPIKYKKSGWTISKKF